ncbi:MAG: hypothetical protein Q9182_001469 [Xanthomendoza sp. 2 TL-2023]
MFDFLKFDHNMEKGGWTRKRPGQKSGSSASAPEQKRSIKVTSPSSKRNDGGNGMYYDNVKDVVPPPPAYTQQQGTQHSKQGGSKQQQTAYYGEHSPSHRGSARVDLRASRRDEAAYGNGGAIGVYSNHGSAQKTLRRSGSEASKSGQSRESARRDAYEGQEPDVTYRHAEASAHYNAHAGSQRGSSRGPHRDSGAANARSSHHSDRQYESSHGNNRSSKMQSVKRSDYGSQRRTGLAPIQEDVYYSAAADARKSKYPDHPLLRSRERRSAAIFEDQHDYGAAGQGSRHSKRTAINILGPSHHSHYSGQKPSEPAKEAHRSSHHVAQYSIHNDFAAPQEGSRGRHDSGYESGRSPPADSGGKRHAKLFGGDRNITLAEF